MKAAEIIEQMPAEQPQARAVAIMTPMDMIQRAVESGADVDMLEKLMALQERWEANQSRKAFDQAVAAAKAEIPAIIKNATGHNNKHYADFAAIAKAVDPIISKHGIQYRFRTVQTDAKITVTCVLFGHGHSEETTLTGPADTSGNKNAIQAIGSTLTYLQRYSLVQALGLAASNDDDGRAAAATGGPISAEQVEQLKALMEETTTTAQRFCGYMKVASLEEIPAASFQRAVDALNAKKSKA